MQHIPDQVSFANAWQPPEMHQLVLVLYMLDKLKELDLAWNEVCDFGSHVLELNMVALTDQISLLTRPARRAILGLVLELPIRDHELEAVRLFVAKLDAHFVPRLLESFADGLTCEQF